jgi:hypothetical protein
LIVSTGNNSGSLRQAAPGTDFQPLPKNMAEWDRMKAAATAEPTVKWASGSSAMKAVDGYQVGRRRPVGLGPTTGSHRQPAAPCESIGFRVLRTQVA